MHRVEWVLLSLGLIGCSSDPGGLTRVAGVTGGSGDDGGMAAGAGGAGGATSSATCRNSLDCTGGNVCNRATGTCVQCLSVSDCASGQVCASNVCRTKCQSDKDCTSLGLLCDQAAGNCVECIIDADCNGGARCSGGVCKAANAGNGGAGGLGGSGTGGSGLGGSAGFGGGFGGVSGAGGMTGCRGQLFDTTQSPLDMAVLFDKSGSMDQAATSGSKLSVIVQAFTAFLNAPENANIGVALTYFPLVIPGVPSFCAVDADCLSYGPCVGGINVGGTVAFGTCQGADVCTVSSYATPAVPFTLPPDHSAVTTSLASATAGGGTPTTGALQGMVQYATGWAAQHPERKVVIVLATDGDPTGCTTNTAADVANVAASALSQSGIPTYVVGVGSSLTSLNQVAQAGGTTQAYLLDTGGALGATFQDAMNQIRTRSAPCRFAVPSAVTDPSKINVLYTPPGTTQAAVIPRASAACGTAGGWLLDPTGAGITICPATCSTFVTGGSVQVESGCATVTGP